MASTTAGHNRRAAPSPSPSPSTPLQAQHMCTYYIAYATLGIPNPESHYDDAGVTIRQKPEEHAARVASIACQCQERSAPFLGRVLLF